MAAFRPSSTGAGRPGAAALAGRQSWVWPAPRVGGAARKGQTARKARTATAHTAAVHGGGAGGTGTAGTGTGTGTDWILYALHAPNNLYQQYAWNTLLTSFATAFGVERQACAGPVKRVTHRNVDAGKVLISVAHLHVPRALIGVHRACISTSQRPQADRRPSIVDGLFPGPSTPLPSPSTGACA